MQNNITLETRDITISVVFTLGNVLLVQLTVVYKNASRWQNVPNIDITTVFYIDGVSIYMTGPLITSIRILTHGCLFMT